MYSCLYIPHFPAWVVERTLEKRRPVVVVASGRVVAASARLRRHGVEAGISAERAETLVPDALIQQREAALEEAAREEVLYRLHAITPFIEPAAPDVVYFRGADEEQLRSFVREMGVRAGTAPHRPTALLAALRTATGSMLPIPPRRLQGFLQRFPLQLLTELGFDTDFLKRLALFGLSSPSDMLHLTRRHLEVQFGDDGVRLYEMLHPSEEPPIPLFRPPPVIRVAFDFEPAVEEPGELLPVLRHLVEEAVQKLGTMHCRRLRLFLHEKDVVREGCRLLPESTSAAKTIFNLSKLLLESLLEEKRRIDVLDLELGALHYADSTQTSLFLERPSIYRAVKAINRRFPGAIKQATIRDGGVFPEDGWEMRAVG